MIGRSPTAISTRHRAEVAGGRDPRRTVRTLGGVTSARARGVSTSAVSDGSSDGPSDAGRTVTDAALDRREGNPTGAPGGRGGARSRAAADGRRPMRPPRGGRRPGVPDPGPRTTGRRDRSGSVDRRAIAVRRLGDGPRFGRGNAGVDPTRSCGIGASGGRRRSPPEPILGPATSRAIARRCRPVVSVWRTAADRPDGRRRPTPRSCSVSGRPSDPRRGPGPWSRPPNPLFHVKRSAAQLGPAPFLSAAGARSDATQPPEASPAESDGAIHGGPGAGLVPVRRQLHGGHDGRRSTDRPAARGPASETASGRYSPLTCENGGGFGRERPPHPAERQACGVFHVKHPRADLRPHRR